jgi:multiple antibiotic resistance protein
MLDVLISHFVILWAVIDPIGTVPVFMAISRDYSLEEKKKIARIASLVALGVLIFFQVVGDLLLKKVGVPLSAFQTSGGIILFLFAINMIFGDSKPEQEIQLVKSAKETAVFPLAIPSIASPGAILAVVLLADSARSTWKSQLVISGMVVCVLVFNYLLMLFSPRIHQAIGNAGAIVISKVMGLILASIAANNILLGIQQFFRIN